MPNIKLGSSDGEIFDVDVEITKASTTIRNMLEVCEESEDDGKPLPLPKITGAILKKVIEWATYHKDDPPLPEENEYELKRTDDICEWDLAFFEVDIVTLFELIRAADYLNIKGLLDTGCKTVANKIKGKTPEEIRLNFNIKDVKPTENGPTDESGPDGGAEGASSSSS